MEFKGEHRANEAVEDRLKSFRAEAEAQFNRKVIASLHIIFFEDDENVQGPSITFVPVDSANIFSDPVNLVHMLSATSDWCSDTLDDMAQKEEEEGEGEE